jgi:dipeptidyl aminopeptidase/acylaminoacyl peptidase
MDVKDLMAGVDYVIKMGVADADRLAIGGWSYGGFLTASTITQTKRFRAAMMGAGITNLISFATTTDILDYVPRHFGGEAWEKYDLLRLRSPALNVKNVNTPTLILQGEQDERVPITQAYEFYNALKRQGRVVKMVVYPRMPHSPREPKQMLDAMKRTIQWFDKYVRGIE